MLIEIDLPRDRATEGVLRLVDGNDATMMSARCRGKADSRRAANEDNPDRDPTRPFGDTPSGLYRETGVHWFPKEANSRLGPAWIPLIGLSGDAERAHRNGRTGLGIHGGRGDERLVATYGCVRLLDCDFVHLATIIANRPVGVIIRDI